MTGKLFYRPTRFRHFLCTFFLTALFSGCSVQKLAVNTTGGIIANGMPALKEESDLPLAETALASNLKLVDVLLRSDPGNQRLLLTAAEGYTSYSLGFVEDESPERASVFYLRARNYGFTALYKNKTFKKAINEDLESYKAALNSFKKEDVAGLFWTANAWGSYINLNKTDVKALADIPRIEAMMEKVLELDETFYYGGPHLFLGTLFASRPRILGGDPKRAKEHFESCLSISNNAFLLPKYFYAKSYAVQVQDRELFRQQLTEILEAPDDLLPEQRLANEIAKRKAKALLAQEDDLFF
jgi:hypothetical protein